MIELPEGKGWFTAGEVARLFEVSKRTVYYWNESGWLMGVRFSPRTLKFRRAQIEEFVEQRKDEI